MPGSRAAAFAALIATATLSGMGSAPAEDFYEGKTIKMIMPTAPGGTYTLYANVVIHHLRQHLPGSPNIVMQFIPGGIAAMNTLYNASSKDGLTIGMLQQTAAVTQVLTPDAVRYDV